MGITLEGGTSVEFHKESLCSILTETERRTASLGVDEGGERRIAGEGAGRLTG